MSYIDGFVCAVPTANRERYLEHVLYSAAVFKDHGATRVVRLGWPPVHSQNLHGGSGHRRGSLGTRRLLPEPLSHLRSLVAPRQIFRCLGQYRSGREARPLECRISQERRDRRRA